MWSLLSLRKPSDTIGLRAGCYAITLSCMQMIRNFLALSFLAAVPSLAAAGDID
jgi:hypothetical protein